MSDRTRVTLEDQPETYLPSRYYGDENRHAIAVLFAGDSNSKTEPRVIPDKYGSLGEMLVNGWMIIRQQVVGSCVVFTLWKYKL